MKFLSFIVNGILQTPRTDSLLVGPQRLVYRTSTSTPGAPATADDDEENTERTDVEERRAAEASRRSAVNRSNFTPEVKQAMRRALSSQNTEYENLVDAVLPRSIVRFESFQLLLKCFRRPFVV